MGELGFEFNASEHETEDSFENIPAGSYTCDIVKEEVKDTKDETGRYVSLQLKIVGPTNAGRVIFDSIALSTTSQESGMKEWVKIGLGKLSALCKATGINGLKRTEELVGKRTGARIGIKPASGGYEARNEVKGYRAPEGAIPGGASAPAQPSKGGVPWG